MADLDELRSIFTPFSDHPPHRLMEDVGKSMAEYLDWLVMSCLPPGFDVKDLARHVTLATGIEIWSWQGRPFLELHPMQISHLNTQTGITVTVTQNYRRL